MPSATFELFRKAVQTKSQVTCMYQNRPREVCPHAVGYKNGVEKVFTYQFGGESSQGLPDGGEWRCLFIEQVQNAALRNGPWFTGDSHLKPQTCVDEIVAEVAH
jgi:hypothetical protein